MENLQYAIGGASTQQSVTTLLGDRFHNLGETLSKRLCTKLGIPVVCSWNVKTSSDKAEELQLLCNLVAKTTASKYHEHLEKQQQQS